MGDFLESGAWSLNDLILALAKRCVVYDRVIGGCLCVVEARYLDLLVCDDFHWPGSEAEILVMNLLLWSGYQMHLILF